MKKEIGVWIDRQEAILVILTNGEEEIRHIPSSSVKYTAYPGNSQARTPVGLTGIPLSDPRDRNYVGQLNKYYEEVIAAIRGADSVQIFGPGEAKGELEQRIRRGKLNAHMPALEATERMTDLQISAKVRDYYLAGSVPGKIEKGTGTPPNEKRKLSTEEARSIGARLNIDWSQVDLEQFRRGLEVELEHGARDMETDVTGDDLLLTGKIAWAHLKEIRDYYTRLDRMEAEAEA
ncbi:MAG TPA: DUF5661 family protein [Anaerolineales bacterium]|nr:DUF5661 family protein [Anaerolineales bacterium]